MEIRKLRISELGEATALILKVFCEFEAPDYTENGVETFKKFLKNSTKDESLVFYGEFSDGELRGVLALGKGCHLTMLFVKKEHHRKGIAKKLFHYIKERCNAERITVNSSPYAVEVYKRLGFEATESEKEIDGIRFTPMVYKIEEN